MTDVFGWYAHFDADFNSRLEDGTVPANLIAYVLPHPIAPGDHVTVSDLEGELTADAEFVEWRFGPSGHRYAAVRPFNWRSCSVRVEFAS